MNQDLIEKRIGETSDDYYFSITSTSRFAFNLR